MPRRTTYNCKVCEREKLYSNHWFVVQQDESGFHIHPWLWAIGLDVLDDEGMEYVCGQVCAHKLLDQFLAGNTVVQSKSSEVSDGSSDGD